MSVTDAHGRSPRRSVVVGLLSIVALSIAAATITSITTSGGGFPGGFPGYEGPSNMPMPGPDPSIPLPLPDGSNVVGFSAYLSSCVPFLASSIGGLVYFGAFAGLLVGVKRRYSFGAAAFAGYGLSPVVLIAYFLSTNCTSVSPGGPSNVGPGPGPPGPSGPMGPIEPSPLLLLGVLGLVIVGTAAVLYRASGNQTDETVEGSGIDDETDGTGLADLATAAGAAADRLEAHNADVDNEVYRAWWEMTTLLNVANPHSSTPGEFADAAVSVGMARDDVEELTRLFEEVRYGQRDHESREADAIEVFRAIEDAYGDSATRDDESPGGEV